LLQLRFLRARAALPADEVAAESKAKAPARPAGKGKKGKGRR